MAVPNKNAFTIGLVMALLFGVVLFLMFTEIFPGPAGKKTNGLAWADDLFNKLAKGSSNFIPRLKETNQKFVGKAFSATVTLPNPEEAERVHLLFTQAGSKVEAQGTTLKIDGDLGKTMEAILRDSYAMFHNQGQQLVTAYGMPERDVMRSWWGALSGMDKYFKKNLKIEESRLVSEVMRRAIEPSYNFYGIEAQRVADRLGIMTFLLVFYVFYTLWWGYAIFYLFEGFGLTMKKAKVKKEV
jgi:hypothetical protein